MPHHPPTDVPFFTVDPSADFHQVKYSAFDIGVVAQSMNREFATMQVRNHIGDALNTFYVVPFPMVISQKSHERRRHGSWAV